MARLYGDEWEIIDSIGEGGQAHTFRVKRVVDGSDNWVLKRLKNPARLGRFNQEIEVLRQLTCDRIPKVEAFSLDEPAYFVYPYIGPTLADIVRGENLSFDEGFDLVRDVVEAVKAAHEANVLHRDIKPNNVVVDPLRGSGRRAYLIDFGICQWEAEGIFKTTTDEPLGNRSFAPPEFELGSTVHPQPGSDVYGLGKLLYWVLTAGQFIPREEITSEAIERIAEPRGVERAHVQRILKSTITPSLDDRLSAERLLSAMEQAGTLIRQGVNAVGAPRQLCPTCRLGHLGRLRELGGLGFSTAGNPPAHVRILRCDHCGYLQHHSIKGTRSEDENLWEV